MQFDELCALVGALRDRVAELEAKEAARAQEIANRPQIVLSERWRIDARGSAEIQAAVRRGVEAGVALPLKATGGQVGPGLYTIGERGPETIAPSTGKTITVTDRNRLS